MLKSLPTGLAVIGLLIIVAATHDPDRPEAEPAVGPMALPDLGTNAWPLCAGGDGQAHCVIDGDTFRLNGVRQRLACINAPEANEEADGERTLSTLAARYLTRVLADTRTKLVSTGIEDRFGRSLVTLVVEQRGGPPLSIEADMVTFGLAEPGNWANTRAFCQSYRVLP
ncbi:MAG: hypothetical protein AAGI03_01525 [Pseudomonadota bacterium]